MVSFPPNCYCLVALLFSCVYAKLNDRRLPDDLVRIVRISDGYLAEKDESDEEATSQTKTSDGAQASETDEKTHPLILRDLPPPNAIYPPIVSEQQLSNPAACCTCLIPARLPYAPHPCLPPLQCPPPIELTCPPPLPCPVPPPCPPPIVIPPPPPPPPPPQRPCRPPPIFPCPVPMMYRPVPLMPPPLGVSQNDCCCNCQRACRVQAASVLHRSRASALVFGLKLRDESLADDSGSRCTDSILLKIIQEMITTDMEESKRAIQGEAERVFRRQFNVVCGRGQFSFVAHTDLYCQWTGYHGAACYAFSPPRMT